MKKNKGTKRALLGSVLVLLLCMAMLIGSTFAWFTDSTATAVNKIQSGNLDVELYSVSSDGTATPVNAGTKLFLENTLWEPGHTEVVTLKVANLGTLALKYRLGINIVKETPSTNVNNEEFSLSSYIKFALIDGEHNYADSAAAISAAEATGKATAISAEGEFDDTLYPTGTDGKASEKCVTLVVYMPTTVGNEANYKLDAEAPTIDLGISLEATQVPYESDSFGPDYDDEAWKVLNAEKVEKNGDIQKALDDALAEGTGYVQLTAQVEKTYTNADPYTKAIEVPRDAEAKIDFAENTLNIQSANGKNGIKADEGSKLTLSNGTITMNKAFGSSEGVVDADEGEIILDHMTVTNSTKDGVCVSAGSDGGKVTIKNSTVTGGSKYSAAVFCGSGSSVVIQNSTIDGHIRAMVNAKIEIRGGDYTKATLDGESKTNIIVYSGIFSIDPSASSECKVDAGSTVVDNGDGTWTVTANA